MVAHLEHLSEPVGEKNPIPQDTHFMLDISKLTCSYIYGIMLDSDNILYRLSKSVFPLKLESLLV
ncbi:MAG: hypothetical protein ACE5RT_06140 [Nitrosopumilaceae archaeon]